MRKINILEQFQCTPSEQITLEYLPTKNNNPIKLKPNYDDAKYINKNSVTVNL